ncbi:hypothetical protein KR038_006121, partial [Drosophila bunnanda]
MKFSVSLCLLLATSGFALMPKHPADLVTMLTRQQFAMRHMMAAPEPRDDASVNDCFNSYLTQQTNVIMNYNKEYTGCLNTADEDRDKLTQESASERQDLIDRTNNMCTSLTACDTLRDGLDFFECYRDASTDSYKTMFTLNSDSNLDFNRINAQYSVIETALTTCVDEARVTYAHDMDTCDESLTVCLNGGVAPTDAPASTTPAPTTAASTTGAPVVTTEEPASTPEEPASTPVVPTEGPASTPVVPTEEPASTPVVTPEQPASTPVVPTEGPGSTPVVPTEEPASTPVVTPEQPASTPVVPTEGPASTPVVPTEEPASTPVVTPEQPASTPVVPTEGPGSTPVATTEAPISTAVPTTERAP